MIRLLSENNKGKPGFATLFSVIILILISTFIISGMLLTNNMTIKENALYRDSAEARILANSCADVAVNKLKLDNTYTGSETITVGAKQCQILAITGSGNSNRVVRTSAVVNTVTRKVEVSITTIRPTTFISYWNDAIF